ncbi:MAG TPA: hypothetical protein PLG98_12200, partial [Smithella sp.]|nr:hypothetical protein [Smithella sp.]HQK79188.1 hypothetical protein [Syntrophales bacterium]
LFTMPSSIAPALCYGDDLKKAVEAATIMPSSIIISVFPAARCFAKTGTTPNVMKPIKKTSSRVSIITPCS